VNSHELARQLLALPDAPAVVSVGKLTEAWLRERPNEVWNIKMSEQGESYSDVNGKVHTTDAIVIML